MIKGYARLATDNIELTKKAKHTTNRIRKCRTCAESTWMTLMEYAKWLKDNGIEVLENFSQFEKLPKLPKYELDTRRRNLFCRICKCYVPAKSRVSEAECPLKLWPKENE